MATAVAQPTEAAPQNGVVQTNSSLYVGDLDREVTEAQLFEVFSQVGPVASIRVCRDAFTRRSLGYAYVNYNNTLDNGAAERALETLNYTPLGGKPMRIMWSHRDPAFRKSGVGNIFIKNLDKTIDNKALHDTFVAFGNILSCKVATDVAGESKGYGFVHFEKEESAQSAIEQVNGMLLEGKKVYVGVFQKRAERPQDEQARYTNVYVKNLAESVDDKELHRMFAEYGQVTSAVVMVDDKGKSKGFGFVNFDDVDAAGAAVDALNGKEIDGKEMYAGRAQKKAEREASLKQKFDEVRQERIQKYQGMNLYIKNLVDEVEDEALRNEFAQYGTITSAKVMRDQAGKSKGFGFVCYATPEEATRAVTECQGRMFMGKPMYVAMAQRREIRRAQLEQQYQQRLPPMAGRPAPGGPMPLYPNGGPPIQFYPAAPGAMGPPARPANAAMMGFPGQMMGAPMRGGPPMQGGRGPRGQAGYGPPHGAPAHAGQHPMMVSAGPQGPGRFGGDGGRGRGRFPRDGGRGGRGLRTGMPSNAPTHRGPQPAVQGPATAPPAATGATGLVPGQEGAPLTTMMLASASSEQQKQMLGERLFPQVQRLQPELAGKITGMLLEMDNSELLVLLGSIEALESKVDEAITVLKQHNALPEGLVTDKE